MVTNPHPDTPVLTVEAMDWRPIETALDMTAIWIHHPYYSHGQGRHGYRGRDGNWRGVNADGTEGPLRFEPTHWMPLPTPPLMQEEPGR